jgi:hypothetical protein
MHPAMKILIGALMIVVGAFSSITFSDQLATLILGGIGPLLVLVGAFIVWLESDEWKMRREEKSDEQREINGLQEQLQNAQSMREGDRAAADRVKRDYSELLEGTVEDAKERVSQMEDPNYDALIAAERGNKGRKTLLRWLERQKS